MSNEKTPIGEAIEVRAGKGAGYTDWIPATVTSLDGDKGFFVTVDGPHGRMEHVWRSLADVGKYWRMKEPYDIIEFAWGIIANASGGNWAEQSADWRAAAERWRAEYRAELRRQQPLAPQPPAADALPEGDLRIVTCQHGVYAWGMCRKCPPAPQPDALAEAVELLHVLWTKAIGTEGYDKKQWRELESAFLARHGKGE